MSGLATAFRIVARLVELNENAAERAAVVAALSGRARFLVRMWLRANRESFPPEVYERILADLDKRET